MRNEGEPSVEEILDSIKKVIARDSRDTGLDSGRDGFNADAAPTAVNAAPEAPFAEQAEDTPPYTSAPYADALDEEGPLEIAEPFSVDPYGDEEAVLDLSDIEFIDSAEEALAAHTGQAFNAPSAYNGPATSQGFSSAFASVQNSLQNMGVSTQSPAATARTAAAPVEAVSERAPVPTPAAVAPVAAAALAGSGAYSAPPSDGLMTDSAAQSMRESLAALARVAAPAEEAVQPRETSLEGLVRDMLRPMLAQWLDENLPEVVERLVKAEIERIMQKRP